MLFIGRLEGSFQMGKRSREVEGLLMEVWRKPESVFREFVEGHYGKVTLIFGGIKRVLDANVIRLGCCSGFGILKLSFFPREFKN